MSNTDLTALKLCLTFTLSLAATGCAVQRDAPSNSAGSTLRRAPGPVGTDPPVHAAVVVHCVPSTLALGEITSKGDPATPTPVPANEISRPTVTPTS